jgi:RHS repeat-associated protein
LTAIPNTGTVAQSAINLTVNPAVRVEIVTYLHTDGLGSAVAKSDASGARIAQTKYEAYGMTVAGSAVPTIGFTGHVNDADTGLTYMQQRYYDPVAARFLSEDPVLTDANTGESFNRYAYAENNPYKYIDPDGRGAVDGLIKIIIKTLIKTETTAVKTGAKEVAKAEAKAAEKVVEGAKRGPKTDPAAPHNAKIRELGDKVEAEGGEVLAGGGRKPEVLVPTPGGLKAGRRPDMISRDANGDVSATQVGKTRADGSPIKREVEALKDLNGPGQLPTTFEGYPH